MNDTRAPMPSTTAYETIVQKASIAHFPFSDEQESALANAWLSSPFASSCCRLFHVLVIWVLAPETVAVTEVAAVRAPDKVETSAVAVLIEEASCCSSVVSASTDCLACAPAAVPGLPSPLSDEMKASVASLTSPTAVCSELWEMPDDLRLDPAVLSAVS